MVVVDNVTGEVCIDDWERGAREVIAGSIVELLDRLEM
jgi:hypothetical protein